VRWIVLFLAWFLDILGIKRLSREWFKKLARPGDPPYVVYVAAREYLSLGQIDAARTLLVKSMEKKPSMRYGRVLIHIFIKERRYTDALQIAAVLSKCEPQNPWAWMLLADIEYFFLNDQDTPFQYYLKALELAKSKKFGVSPLKVAYKRVCRFLEERDRDEDLIKYLLEFLELQSSNFHDHEFYVLTKALLKQNRFDEARSIIALGIKAYPKSGLLRRAWEELGFGKMGDLPPMPVRGKRPPDSVRLLPVKTRLFVEGDEPVQIMKEWVKDVKSDDVAILSSCVAGLMEGRIFMEGAVKPGIVAKTLSRFVDQKDVPFGGAAPMCNPLSMQVLLEEIGTLRTLLAALAGGIGKVFGKKGWFYIVAGRDAGQIDDTLGSLPPYDYYVIMGPRDPFALSKKIASEIGCEAAIVDANDLGVAWAVGYSEGVDPDWLEEVMSTNPAGNQEQQTPIVLVKRSRACLSQEVRG